jgi:hypothetical protein
LRDRVRREGDRMPFGIGEEKTEEEPIEVKQSVTDEQRQHIIRRIDLSDVDYEEVESEIQADIDAMLTKGFKPVTTTIDSDNQLYYIIYERMRM